MTLRTRLTAAFLVIVMGPLLLGAILIAHFTPQVRTAHTVAALKDSRQAVRSALSFLCQLSGRDAEVLALRASTLGAPTPAGTSARSTPQTLVESFAPHGSSRVAALQDARGQIIARAGALPPGGAAALPTVGHCALAGGRESPVLLSGVALQQPSGATAGQAWYGYAIDQALARQLVHTSGNGSAGPAIALTFVADGKPLASSLSLSAARTMMRETSAGSKQSGDTLVVAQQASRHIPVGFVLSTQTQPPTGIYFAVTAVLLAALVAGVAVAFRLAHAITAPLGAMGEAAERVAAGDLETRVPFRRRDEIGRLAESFNTMTSELRSYVDALRAGRDQLRRNLNLLGDTLSSTHDLHRILTVIIDTAMAASGARAGAVFLDGSTDLRCEASRGFGPDSAHALHGLRVQAGEGLVGRVAETGEPLLGRRSDGTVDPLVPEPYGSTYIAVPIKSTGRLLGVLVLTDRLGSDDFDDTDLDTLRSFASQAAVAVENVLLHEEAQRLSLTDGLTGLWNYRYFQMNFAKEIERASRFDRPLALLMLDIDRFKEVNDTHGHQRGDAVLVELARRISAVIREVDLLARYGGEEIMLVLPETDELGAQRTAERVCEVVRSTPVPVPGGDGISITVSVGIAVFPKHGASVAALVERADDALYAAKAAGRDTWRTAESDGSVPV